MKKFDWLKKYFENRTDNPRVNVSEVIPDEFDSYFLMHWNVGIVDNFPFDEYPSENESIEDINGRIRIERAFKLFLNPEEDELFRECDLKEISELFDTEYTYRTLNKIKKTPAVKILHEKSMHSLISTIDNLSQNQQLNLYVEDFYKYPNHELPKQEMENVSAHQYIEFQKSLFFNYWTYLFPNDRSWCITTAEDFPMFLCVRIELTESLEEYVNMELFKIDYNERLYE